MGKQDNFGPLVLKFGSSDLVVEYFFFKMAKILGRCSVHKRLISKWLSGKEAACQCKRCIVTSSIPDMGRSPGEENGYLLEYSCLGNPRERGACRLQSIGSQRVGHN